MARDTIGRFPETPIPLALPVPCPTVARILAHHAAADAALLLGADAQVPSGGAGPVLCFCGPADRCPHWARLTPGARVVCAQDKRAVLQALWKTGVHG